MSIKRLNPEEWAAARIAWEADPQLSYSMLATRMGVQVSTISRRAEREGWKRVEVPPEKVVKRADEGAAVERLQRPKAKPAADGKPDGNSKGDGNGDSNGDSNGESNGHVLVLKKDASDHMLEKEQRPSKPVHDPKAVEEMAIQLRADVTSRHRAEWQAARQLSYEAIKAKDFDKAKLAKITSETLKIIQDGERKAWGLDAPEAGDTPPVVVIERGQPATTTR